MKILNIRYFLKTLVLLGHQWGEKPFLLLSGFHIHPLACALCSIETPFTWALTWKVLVGLWDTSSWTLLFPGAGLTDHCSHQPRKLSLLAGLQRLAIFSGTGVGMMRSSIPSTCGVLPPLPIAGATALISWKGWLVFLIVCSCEIINATNRHASCRDVLCCGNFLLVAVSQETPEGEVKS